jgi:hypothetical protein
MGGNARSDLRAGEGMSSTAHGAPMASPRRVRRRLGLALAIVVVGAGGLSGCYYDPYTGGYYPYPSYPSGYPAAYPYRPPPAYPGQPSPYPGQSGPYPGQSGPYSGQPGPYSGQPGPYSGQPEPYSAQPPPYGAGPGAPVQQGPLPPPS